MKVILDIETIAQPIEVIRPLMPEFTPPANYKDPEKIAANLAEQQAKWIEGAALSAMTGRIAILGIKEVWGSNNTQIHVAESLEDERSILAMFWAAIAEGPVIGWNLKGFDIPFIIQRSWIHGLRVKESVWNGKWLSNDFSIDLMERWCCGNGKQTAGLGAVSKACGVGEKTGTGAEFGKLWEIDRQKAIEYCRHDLELTFDLAKRMGVVHE
jgi:predicted PolB exonuclease-like 3'-5' exonuclease